MARRCAKALLQLVHTSIFISHHQLTSATLGRRLPIRSFPLVRLPLSLSLGESFLTSYSKACSSFLSLIFGFITVFKVSFWVYVVTCVLVLLLMCRRCSCRVYIVPVFSMAVFVTGLSPLSISLLAWLFSLPASSSLSLSLSAWPFSTF